MSVSAIQPLADEPVALTHHVRFVTAASLFDGHDAVSYTHLRAHET